MAKKDDVWKLAEAVERLERVVRAARASGGSPNTSILVSHLESLKDRMAVEESEIQTERETKKQLTERELALVFLVEQETALSLAEREQYGAFLSHEFFTKADFEDLAGFYANTWDRLSENGKAQMSHRVWEGVRQEQYQFSELPEEVKAKEAQRLYDLLSRRTPPAELLNIPEMEREVFLRQWKAGNRSEAHEILNRPEFAGNVALSAKPVPSASAEVVNQSQALKIAQTEMASPKQSNSNIDASLGELELGLNDLKLVESGSAKIDPAPFVTAATQAGEAAIKR